MVNYADSHQGRLPPAVVYGESGEPLYSWRVLILPCIEQNDLYKEFHLDEPWDSPHNLALLPRMPATYAAPGSKKSKLPPYHTVCHVFVGRGAPFEGREGLRWPADFPKGTSNTLLVVEAGEPVPWSKPSDLTYDPDGPLPDLRCLFKDGFRAALADGSTRWVGKGTSEATLRWAISRNCPMPVSIDW
jgi:Protein of unknown function (DUF1559)